MRQRIEGATLNGHFSLSSCRPLCWKLQSRNLGGRGGQVWKTRSGAQKLKYEYYLIEENICGLYNHFGQF